MRADWRKRIGCWSSPDRTSRPWTHKGLALCGLALCEDERHLPAAEEAFAAARKITRAKGVVASVLNLFDALAVADKERNPAPARKAAEGE